MFERILVPLDRSPLAECVLPQAIALSRYPARSLSGSTASLRDRQDRLRRLPACALKPVLRFITVVCENSCRHEND